MIVLRNALQFAASSHNSKLLPYLETPGPKDTSNMMANMAGEGLHLDIVPKRSEKFGSIYRKKVFEMEVVYVYNWDLAMEVLRTGTSFHIRLELSIF